MRMLSDLNRETIVTHKGCDANIIPKKKETIANAFKMKTVALMTDI